MPSRRQRVVIVGAGIAGSLITAGLAQRRDIELVCLERVGPHDHAEAGTGLNIGPNAMKCLAAHLPDSAAAIVANSLPWENWRISLTDGRPLMDLQLDTVADNAGIRIRWAELYALLREPIHRRITFGAELTGCARDAGGVAVTWRERAVGASHRIEGIDLLIAADGRYSPIRDHVLGAPETPRLLGVCLYRVLFPAGVDCPIDDYGQWFNGANRLLAFRVPGDFIYCAGSFPIPADGGIPEAMKTAEFLGGAYRPERGDPSPQAAYLIAAIQRHADRIHWARLQEGSVAYGREPGVLLVGDSAHPMVPTLGQGATQACEDACVVVDEVRLALEHHRPLATVPERVEHRRGERVRFVVEFSREATDTMLAGGRPGCRNAAEVRAGFPAQAGAAVPRRADAGCAVTSFLSVGNMSIDDLVFPDGTTLWCVPGGNSVYAALGMALWGERPELLAVLGPEYPLDALGGRVDVGGARRHHVNLRNWGLYEEDGSRQFVFRRATGNWLEFCPELSDLRAGPVDWCHLAPLPWSRQADFVAALRDRGARAVTIDPDDRRIAEVPRAEVCSLLRQITAFLPSRQDAEALFPKADPGEAMRRLRELGPDTPFIALKLGADGVLVHRAGDPAMLLVPPVTREIADATGAGDAFCGGFLVGLARHDDALTAALMGSVSASFATEAVGPKALARASPELAASRLSALAGRVQRRDL